MGCSIAMERPLKRPVISMANPSSRTTAGLIALRASRLKAAEFVGLDFSPLLSQDFEMGRHLFG
jgi:hypothetical protein